MARGNGIGITRRRALSGSACLIRTLLSESLWAEPKAGETQTVGEKNSAELYVFPGRGETTVIATTWPAQSPRLGFTTVETSCVKIHTGGNTFKIDLSPDHHLNERYENGCRIYAGRVRSWATPVSPNIETAVIEVPNELLAGPALEVWAERLDPNDCRQRVGSPFLANIVRENKDLAGLYHSTSPET